MAWLRVDTQTILTIQSHVITKNHRIGVTHSEHKTWFLHIREVKATDKGWYMCQINTDPMKSQVGYLDVVGKFFNSIDIYLMKMYRNQLFQFHEVTVTYCVYKSNHVVLLFA